MSYTVYRIGAWNGKREVIGTAETATKAAELCEEDRRKHSHLCVKDQMFPYVYEIVGKETRCPEPV